VTTQTNRKLQKRVDFNVASFMELIYPSSPRVRKGAKDRQELALLEERRHFLRSLPRTEGKRENNPSSPCNTAIHS
jgi:hypothetical protein